MAIVRIFAGMESGEPRLQFQNDRDQTVRIRHITFQRGDAGSCPYYVPAAPLTVQPGRSARILGGQVDGLGQSLQSKLQSLLSSTDQEAVIRIRIDLDPPQAEQDQPAPSFYVIRAENGRITEFFPLQGSLQGQPSLLDALLDSRQHGS